MSDPKQTAKEAKEQAVRAPVEARCAANLASVGGLNMVHEGAVVPAVQVLRDGVEAIVPLASVSPSELRALGYTVDDDSAVDEVAADDSAADKTATDPSARTSRASKGR